MMEFDVRTKRLDSHGSEATCKSAHTILDTDMQGRSNAFNPVELLLAAVSACIIKGIERIAPMLDFSLNGVEVHVHGVRQDAPPKMASIQYEVIVDTDESGQRLELLHENIHKYGTVYNTVAPGTVLTGTIIRKGKACV